MKSNQLVSVAMTFPPSRGRLTYLHCTAPIVHGDLFGGMIKAFGTRYHNSTDIRSTIKSTWFDAMVSFVLIGLTQPTSFVL